MAGALSSHGLVWMRSSAPMISSSRSPPLVSVVSCPLHHRTISAAVAAPVRQRRKLQCKREGQFSTTSFRSSSSFASPYPLTNCSEGLLNLWYLQSIHTPFRPKRKMSQDRLHLVRVGENEAVNDDEYPIRTRKVVEHVVLFKMEDNLTEEQEKEMLDSLWSLQYQIKNVLCSTAGRLVQKTPEGYTHALFSRFPNTQAVDEYMKNPARWRVAQDLVIPFYHGKLIVDFAGEVEDDIETIFRRGDDFQEGVEVFLLFKFKDNASSDAVDKFLKAANSLPLKYGKLVQLTIGANFDSQSKGTYSHGLVARLPSEGASAEFEKFLDGDASWIEALELLEPSRTLMTKFLVSPIGKTLL